MSAYSDAQVREIIAERDGLYQTLAREVAKLASATTRHVEAEAEVMRLRALVVTVPAMTPMCCAICHTGGGIVMTQHDVVSPLDARGCCAACHEPMDHENHRLQTERVERVRAEAEVMRFRAFVGRMRDALTQALETIRTWHGMRLRPEEEPDLWSLYKVEAPEMQPILAVLVDPDGQRVEAEWRALLELENAATLIRTTKPYATLMQDAVDVLLDKLAAVERARQS